MLDDIGAYEQFVYGLQEAHRSINVSTLVVVRVGATIAEVRGTIEFGGGVTLGVWEDIDFGLRRIRGYAYWVERDGERLYWYDPQPHPDDVSLRPTFPHHKHVAPNIKRHRIPAPGLSFDTVNLPVLIQEIERDLLP